MVVERNRERERVLHVQSSPRLGWQSKVHASDNCTHCTLHRCRHCARFGNFTVICCLIQDVLSVNTHANYILRYNHLHVIEGRNTCLGSGVTRSTEPVCFSRELALLHRHIIKAESIQPSSIPRYVCLYSLYLC